jgi:hypothetical protein
MIQKALSECMALILLMDCYLMLNDDLGILSFASIVVKEEHVIFVTFTSFNNTIIFGYQFLYFVVFNSND